VAVTDELSAPRPRRGFANVEMLSVVCCRLPHTFTVGRDGL
jgi:hypothetical protein